MGKDLRGKELGVGLSQEKNGLYLARFTDRFGKRQSKRFTKLWDCREWLADAMFTDEHYNVYKPNEMIVDAWFKIWFEDKQKTTKPNTIKTYNMVYREYVEPVIGQMLMPEVKPMHCQLIMNKIADKGLKNSTINLTKLVLHNFFELALVNEVVNTNPCNGLVKANIGKESEEKEALTLDEHKRFIECIKGHELERQFRFVLQTGIRGGELGALKWDDVDFDAKTIRVDENMSFDREISLGTPKSKTSIRTIPLTDEAVSILKEQKKIRSGFKVVPMEWKEFVFLDEEDGTPIVYSKYNSALKSICRRNGIRHISLHILRHTFATRCIEAGMKPKTLQKILGHSNISITMNRYVHTTDDEKRREMDLVAKSLVV